MTDVTTSKTVPNGNTTLQELLARVEAGEELIITRDGSPIARFVAVARTPEPATPLSRPISTKPRQFGLYAGWGTIGPEFFEPLPEEELRLWEGADE